MAGQGPPRPGCVPVEDGPRHRAGQSPATCARPQGHLGHLAFALASRLGATVSAITLAAAQDATFGRLYRETLLAERRQAILDILLAGRERGTVRADADLTVVVDMAFGALHHRLLLTKAPIDGPFVVALTDLIVAATRASHPSPPPPPPPPLPPPPLPPPSVPGGSCMDSCAPRTTTYTYFHVGATQDEAAGRLHPRAPQPGPRPRRARVHPGEP